MEVNGWNFSGTFPLKNPQISQTSQHPLRKILHSLKGLSSGIFYQIDLIYKCNCVGDLVQLPLFITQ